MICLTLLWLCLQYELQYERQSNRAVLPKAEGNIDGRGETKLTVSRGASH